VRKPGIHVNRLFEDCSFATRFYFHAWQVAYRNVDHVVRPTKNHDAEDHWVNLKNDVPVLYSTYWPPASEPHSISFRSRRGTIRRADIESNSSPVARITRGNFGLAKIY
jgi:hypothetical protein